MNYIIQICKIPGPTTHVFDFFGDILEKMLLIYLLILQETKVFEGFVVVFFLSPPPHFKRN